MVKPRPAAGAAGGCQRQLGTRLSEGLLGDLAHQLGSLAQMRKEFVEFALNAFSHAAEQQRNQGWQWQFALAREGRGMIGMDCVQEKFGRAKTLCKIGEKGVEVHFGQ